MELATSPSWSPDDYCDTANTDSPGEALAATIYERVCRTDFTAPGFCLIDLGSVSSVSMRRFMVSLKRSLQRLHQSRQSRDLVFVSAARFDQQVTTKPHRDAGPDECFLMLGYEPSQVPAEIAMSDYSMCAHAMGMTPHELLEKHNPMFASGKELLRPYMTRVDCFSNRNSQIVLINNSVAPFSENGTAWQGVLHTAAIRSPADDLRRVVNSTMVASVPIGAAEPVSDAEQEEFINTTGLLARPQTR